MTLGTPASAPRKELCPDRTEATVTRPLHVGRMSGMTFLAHPVLALHRSVIETSGREGFADVCSGYLARRPSGGAALVQSCSETIVVLISPMIGRERMVRP
jgi:hypothetical protein